MVYELIKSWAVLILLLFSSLLNWVGGEPQVPCYFIFGDSLVDNGNNNALLTLAKANYLPYGIDFRSGPTGRFSNGRTMADIIAELLGFDDYIPSSATANGQEILNGVNYASAAAGIRNETGQQLGVRISLDEQLRNHQTIVSRIVNILGNNNSAANYLSKCLYSVGMGSNDYINNYLLPELYPTSRQYTPEQYADVLIQQYSQQIMTLYNYGARKVSLSGLGPIGCTPHEIVRYGTNGSTCVENINSAVQFFNNRLRSLVDTLNNYLTDAKFIYLNIYDIATQAAANPSSFGFKVVNAACCGVGKNNGLITCLPLQVPCFNRTEYVFWDAFHPTEAANKIAAGRSFAAQSPSDAYPMDIRRLARL